MRRIRTHRHSDAIPPKGQALPRRGIPFHNQLGSGRVMGLSRRLIGSLQVDEGNTPRFGTRLDPVASQVLAPSELTHEAD